MASFFSLLLGSCKSNERYQNMTVRQFEQFIAKPNVQLLDVRSSEEFLEGHISSAINVDAQGSHFVDNATAKLDKGKQVAVYCRSGRRSARAAQQLTKAGFKVTNLTGGIIDWQVAGKEVVK